MALPRVRLCASRPRANPSTAVIARPVQADSLSAVGSISVTFVSVSQTQLLLIQIQNPRPFVMIPARVLAIHRQICEVRVAVSLSTLLGDSPSRGVGISTQNTQTKHPCHRVALSLAQMEE